MRAEAALRAAARGIRSFPLRATLDRSWMRGSWILPGPANEWNIRIIAMRRSGHHAIVNWVRKQIPGRHCFLNDCVVGRNPFAGCNRLNSVVKGWVGEHGYLDWESEIGGRHAKKGALIRNYEDADPEELVRSGTNRREEEWLGRSKRSVTILLLRDPFNLMASRLKWLQGGRGRSLIGLDTSRFLWKDHAREFLGETDWLEDKICLSYNEWHLSREYRDRLSRLIGFENLDKGFNEVARWGPALWGHSFDGFRYEDRAQDMKVMERWREYEGDSLFREQFADEQLVALSRTIFGEIEGTEALCAGIL